MVALPWVLSVLVLNADGSLHETDVARFDKKEQCVAALSGTQWQRLREPFDGKNIVQRACRKVTYGPKNF